MKVSIILHTSQRKPGGGFKVIYEYSNYLIEKGNSVTIYYLTKDMYKKYHFPNFIKKFLCKISIRLRPNWFNLNKKIRKIGINQINNDTIKDSDVVIATEVTTAYPVFCLSKEKGEKYYFIQGYENWTLSDREVLDTYKLKMTHIVVSKWLKDIVDEYSSNPAILISNSVDLNVFSNIIPSKERKLHSIVFQYRNDPKKGCDVALEVIKLLKYKYSDLEIICISNEKKPKTFPKDIKYYHNVKPEMVAKLNNRCTLFLCTSIEEGFGLPGLEAMACGCVVVSTNYLGVREYALDNNNSLLSNVNDVHDLYNNICNVFEDEKLRIKLSSNALKTAKEYNYKDAAEKFLNTIGGVNGRFN